MEDLTGLDFSLSLCGSGSAGSFYKAIDSSGRYYKASYVLKDGFGFESVNEVLCSRVADLFGFPNAGYELVEAEIRVASKCYSTYVCRSENFKRLDESRLSLEVYCTINSIVKGYIEPFIFEPFYKDLVNMLFFDYIIDNRDRHGANIELLCSGDSIRLAPIYDCGSSLLSPCQYSEERLRGFGYLHDGPVNNFLVSMWWSDVLGKLVKLGYRVPEVYFDKLLYSDLYVGFRNEYRWVLDSEISMIKERYDYAKKILNT